MLGDVRNKYLERPGGVRLDFSMCLGRRTTSRGW